MLKWARLVLFAAGLVACDAYTMNPDTSGDADVNVSDVRPTDDVSLDVSELAACRSCSGTCWEQIERPSVMPIIPDVPPSEEVSFSNCNASSIPESCPNGFRCGTTLRTVYTDVFGSREVMPACEPSDGAVISPIDLTVAGPSAEGMPVRFRFRLNGGPWPSLATSANVGSIDIRSIDRSSGAQVRVPSATDDVTVSLLPGVYEVQVNLRGNDAQESPFPWARIDGRLTVCSGGTVDLDVVATRTLVSVTLDGRGFPTLGDGDQVWVLLDGFSGTTPLLSFERGESLGRHVLLEPGNYLARVSVMNASSLAVPRGTYRHAGPLGVPRPGLGGESLVIPATSVSVDGTVRVDGDRFQGEGSLFWRHTDGGFTFSSTILGGSYAVRVLSGPYDVLLDVPAGSAEPAGGSRLRNAWMPASGTHDLDVETLRWNGELTLNESPLADAGEIQIVLDTGERSKRIVQVVHVAVGSPTTFDARVYAGTFRVAVVGSPGGILPLFPVELATPVELTVEPLRFNINAHRARLTATIDGSTPPDRPTGSRGVFLFRPVTGETEWRAIDASRMDELSGEVVLPDGRWLAYLAATDATYAQGWASLGEIEVGPTDVSASFDVATLDVSGTVLVGGRAFPEPPSSFDRGSLFFAGPSGLERVPIRAGGEYAATLLAGLYNIGFACGGTCDPSLGARSGVIVRGIDLR